MTTKLDVDVRAIAAEYRAGATLADLGRHYGLARDTIRLRLLTAGVQLRAPGRRPTTARFMSRPAAGPRAVASRRADGPSRPSLGAPGAEGTGQEEQRYGS